MFAIWVKISFLLFHVPYLLYPAVAMTWWRGEIGIWVALAGLIAVWLGIKLFFVVFSYIDQAVLKHLARNFRTTS